MATGLQNIIHSQQLGILSGYGEESGKVGAHLQWSVAPLAGQVHVRPLLHEEDGNRGAAVDRSVAVQHVAKENGVHLLRV